MSSDLAERRTSAVDERTTTLGRTLRYWRDRAAAPSHLAVRARRRAPGLRRSELAALAGVSVAYVTQLEQGRATTPSDQVLHALARALSLTAIERDHLFRLANRPVPAEIEPPALAPEAAMASLAAFSSLPAALYTVRWDIVAWNERWVTLLGDPLERAPSERNLVWRHFAGLPSRLSRSEEQVRQFEREVVADLREASARYPGDPDLRRFVEALRHVSDRFAELWERHEVAAYRGDRKLVQHPVAGPMELDCVIVDPRVDGFHIALFSARSGSAAEEPFAGLIR